MRDGPPQDYLDGQTAKRRPPSKENASFELRSSPIMTVKKKHQRDLKKIKETSTLQWN
jgi:hypothetical protein